MPRLGLGPLSRKHQKAFFTSHFLVITSSPDWSKISSILDSQLSKGGVSPHLGGRDERPPTLNSGSGVSAPASNTNRWVPPSSIPRGVLTAKDKNDQIFRRVRGILNKLTPEKFDKLSLELLNVGIETQVILKGIILLIFEKALEEPKYSSLYAQLCHRLCEDSPNFDPPSCGVSTFRRLLLNKCQDEFENRSHATEVFDKKDGALTAEEQEQYHIIKKKMLGNLKFIGELGKLNMLHEGILHKCIKQLLEKKKNAQIKDMSEDLECLCQIMRTIGPRIDTPKARAWMDQYFERVNQFAYNCDLPSRIRFMLQDVIELRDNGWTPRKIGSENGPKTISQIRGENNFNRNGPQSMMNMNGIPGTNWKGGMGDLFSMPVGSISNAIGVGPGVIQMDSFSGMNNMGGRNRFYAPNQGGYQNNFNNKGRKPQGQQGQGQQGQQQSSMENGSSPNSQRRNNYNNQGGGGGYGNNNQGGERGDRGGGYNNGTNYNQQDGGGSGGGGRGGGGGGGGGGYNNQGGGKPGGGDRGGYHQYQNNYHQNNRENNYHQNNRENNYHQNNRENNGYHQNNNRDRDNIGGGGGGNYFNQQQSGYHNQQQQQQQQQNNKQGGGGQARDLPPRFQRLAQQQQGPGGPPGGVGGVGGPPSSSSAGSMMVTNSAPLGAPGQPPPSASPPMVNLGPVTNGIKEDVSLRPMKSFTVFKPNTPSMLPRSAQAQNPVPRESGFTAKKSTDISEIVNPLLEKQQQQQQQQQHHQQQQQQQPESKKQSKEEKKSPQKEKLTKDKMIDNITSLLAECYVSHNISDTVMDIRNMRIPKHMVPDMISHIMVNSLEKNDAEQELSMKLIDDLRSDKIISTDQFMEGFKRVCKQIGDLETDIPLVKSHVARFGAMATTLGLTSLSVLSEPFVGGVQYPLFLLCLQHMHKIKDKEWLVDAFNKSKLDLIPMLPEHDQHKERMLEILEDRGLSFMFPLMRIQSELVRQIAVEPSAAAVFKWVKEKVDAPLQTDPRFVNILVTCILKYITQESTLKEDVDATVTPDKAAMDKEKDLLDKLKGVLQMFLHDHTDLQMAALYAVQVFCNSHEFPKGMFLRFFVNLYDMEVIDEEVYLQWKEEVNDQYPGKGKALFQVNQWLNWLEQAEDDSEEDTDDEEE